MRSLSQYQSLATAAVLAVFAASAYAQSTTQQSSTATASSSAAAATHTVKVGWPIGRHAFSPETTSAKIGDTILFEMYPSNHSVVHMDPNSPCVPINLAGHPTSDLWWSGFYPVSDASNPGTFDIVVNTTSPIWFYCSVPDSCIKYEMVGVININSSKNSLQSVKLNASKANFSLSPGEKIPSDSSQSGATSASTGASSSTGSNSSGDNGSSSTLSGGAIAGIVIGAIGAFALVGLLFFLVGRKKKADEVKEKAAADAEAAANAQTPAPDGQSPPTYQDDPRYSVVPGSPPQDNYYGAKPGHASLIPDGTSTTASLQERHPHRMSELPSQNYDPVELYTPSPEQQTFPRGAEPAADDRR